MPQNTVQIHEDYSEENNTIQDMGNEQYKENIKEQHNTEYEDDVSIEDGSAEYNYLTINDMNTVHEMHAGQLNVDPNTGEEEIQGVPMPTHP